MYFNLTVMICLLEAITDFLSPSSGDRIISPNTSKFGQYSNDFGWIGTLNEFDNQSMYQTHFTSEDVLTYIGFEVDPFYNEIPYNPRLELDCLYPSAKTEC